MKTKKTTPLILSILIIISCRKESTQTIPADVYISGNLLYNSDSSIYLQAVYWKNQQLVMLSNNGENTYATDIFINGNDVYVAGYISYGRTNAPVYWKNGVINMLPMQNPGAIKNGIAKKIIVINNVVYVTGAEYYSGEYVLKVWQNGVGTNLTAIGNRALPNDMDYSSGNVYVVGYESNSDTASNIYNNNWINNITQSRIGNNTSVLNGIKVIGSDIYTIGTINNSSVCRINIVAQTYFNNAVMKEIDVSDHNIYIAGVSQNRAACWINDSLFNISSSFISESSADGIAVISPDIHIVGYEKNASNKLKARYWINAQSINLNDSTALGSIANGIFLVKR